MVNMHFSGIMKNCNQINGNVVFEKSGGNVAYRIDGKMAEQYDYLVFDVENKEDYGICLMVSFWEDTACTLYASIGILPSIKTTVCLPLSLLDGQTLFARRRNGILKTVIKGNKVDTNALSAFSIGIPACHKETELALENIRLINEGELPEISINSETLIDEMGQYAGKSWLGKTEDIDALKAELLRQAKEAEVFLTDYEDGFYGYSGATYEATGFFRLETENGNQFIVTPDGHPFISSGIDCVNPNITGVYDDDNNMKDFLKENFKLVFGEEWREKWKVITKHNILRWGFNTIGAWSDLDFAKEAKIPFVVILNRYPNTAKTVFRDFPDVFSQEFEKNAKTYAEQLVPWKNEPYMLGYFMSNEPHWAFVDKVNIGYELLRNQQPLESKKQLVLFMQERYSNSIAKLNEEWHTMLEGFDDLFSMNEFPKISEAGMKALDLFSCEMIKEYIRVPAVALREQTPNHLNLGIRYAYISSDALYSGSEYFDIFSINCYERSCESAVKRVSQKSQKPVMIGEYHFGAIDRGLPATGIRGVRTQKDRGLAISYYIKNMSQLPFCVGAHYFQLYDQAFLGRFDGENYNIGFLDVCNKEYKEVTDIVTTANRSLYAGFDGSHESLKELEESIDYIPAIFY